MSYLLIIVLLPLFFCLFFIFFYLFYSSVYFIFSLIVKYSYILLFKVIFAPYLLRIKVPLKEGGTTKIRSKYGAGWFDCPVVDDISALFSMCRMNGNILLYI